MMFCTAARASARSLVQFSVPLLLSLSLPVIAVGTDYHTGYESNFQTRFPTAPDPDLTEGSLCDTPTEYRYPEGIPYCERNVDTSLKREIIKTYDRELGYSIGQMDRQQFKIDHYVPLCAGGSNDVDNLWPQHKSVYEITDQMEHTICEKMKAGALKQSDAVAFIRIGKNDLSKVKEIMRTLNSL